MTNCEYLVYAKSGDKISTQFEPILAAQIYEILSKLAYPMRTNPLYKSYILSTLSSEQHTRLIKNETEVILEVLRKINPELNIIPISKTLYQFYLYTAYYKIPITNIQKRSLVPFFEDLRNSSLQAPPEIITQAIGIAGFDLRPGAAKYIINGVIIPPYNSLNPTAFYEACDAINFSMFKQSIWQAMNTALVFEFASKGFMSNAKILSGFINTWTKKYLEIVKESNLQSEPGLDGFMYDQENVFLLANIMQMEAYIMFRPEFKKLYALYRGSPWGPRGDTRLLHSEPKHSLSFSNGLCDGIISDKGACAWTYMQSTNRHDVGVCSGYMLLVDTASSTNKVNVPPINAVSRSFGVGENFHPRTQGSVLEVEGYLLDRSLILTDMRSLLVAKTFPKTGNLLLNYALFKNADKTQPVNSAIVPYNDSGAKNVVKRPNSPLAARLTR